MPWEIAVNVKHTAYDVFSLWSPQHMLQEIHHCSGVLLHENASQARLNDYHLVALTSVVIKCFERPVKDHICSSLPITVDPLQFAFRPNTCRSTDSSISRVVHDPTPSYIDNNKEGKYVRLLFINCSSAFNTIDPTRLASKLWD